MKGRRGEAIRIGVSSRCSDQFSSRCSSHQSKQLMHLLNSRRCIHLVVGKLSNLPAM